MRGGFGEESTESESEQVALDMPVRTLSGAVQLSQVSAGLSDASTPFPGRALLSDGDGKC